MKQLSSAQKLNALIIISKSFAGEFFDQVWRLKFILILLDIQGLNPVGD